MRIFMALVGVLAFGAPALAQARGTHRPSFNLGAALARYESDAHPGPAGRLSMGTDLPLNARFSLRVETGQRLPRRSHVRHEMTVFLYDAEAGFVRGLPVPRVTEVDETALGDLSLMLRFNSPPGESLFEVAALAGVSATWFDFARTVSTPRSLHDPADIDVIHEDHLEMRPSYDIGMEVGRFVGDRWTVIAQGMIGVEKPFDNDIRVQPRAGIILKRRF